MKHYKTAKAILRHALAEIEAGRWCKLTLATSTFGEQSFPDCFVPKDDPMGCALGLISVYGGHGRPATITLLDGREFESFVPEYPAYDNGGTPTPKGVLEARDALFMATPKGFREQELRDLNGGGDSENRDRVVYAYNDHHADQETAAKWFRRALELV